MGDDDDSDVEAKTFTEKLHRSAKLLLPHLALVLLCVAYIFIGATVFYIIELPSEFKARNQTLARLFSVRQKFFEHIWDIAESRTLAKQEWVSKAIENVDELQVEYYKAFKSRYIVANDLRDPDDKEMILTFTKSIVFSADVITRTGNGHIAPHTNLGRIFCIIFTLFGIPLCAVMIADIGKFLSEFLTAIYQRKKSNEDSDELIILSPPSWMFLVVLVGYAAFGSILFKVWQGWSLFEAFYFCFMSFTAIGLGDVVPTNHRLLFVIVTIVYVMIGLVIATVFIDLVGIWWIRMLHKFFRVIKDAVYEFSRPATTLEQSHKKAS